MNEDEEARAKAFALFVTTGGLELTERIIDAEERNQELATSLAHTQTTVNHLEHHIKARIETLESLVREQMDVLDECYRDIEAEYGNGPAILFTIEDLRMRAQDILSKQEQA